MPQKKIFLKTFGCQMNVYDSQRILQLLAQENYILVDNPREADLIFLNTCTVREKPAQKVYSILGRLRPLKKKNPHLIIGVGGCLAQQEGENLLARFAQVDFVLGTKEFNRLLEILDTIEKSRTRLAATELKGRIDPYAGLPLGGEPNSAATAFVSIMQGCDNFCSFCIVPLVRGREVSRPSRDILKEISLLAQKGVKEVTLLGQNVNAYGKTSPGELDFGGLLRAIQEIPGIERIRFTTSHPRDLSESLIACFGQLSKLCEHIHLPLQSGSDRILKLMNRGYTFQEYMQKIKMLRQVCPEISITTDMIVGFPGEKEEDFQASLEALSIIEFDEMFSFKYSDRPGTKASYLSEKVPEEIKEQRLRELQTFQKKITQQKNKAYEGKIVQVLVEGKSKNCPQESTGRTRTNRIVNFPGIFEPGSLVDVKIVQAYAHSLRGEVQHHAH
ncbi:MAG: tRNA (N6-isopentenyl adenosine(37)-C2)-methylthiotransferase MiaB [Thermodesulfobacteriota bacterium]